MSTSDATLIRDTLRSFRKKEIEAQWEALNLHDDARYEGLWAGLCELGVPSALDGGVDPDSCLEIGSELGAACPALGALVISHVVARSLLVEAAGALPAALGEDDARVTLVSSPLDREPDTQLLLQRDGAGLRLSGEQRVIWAQPRWLVLAARDGDSASLCLLRTDTAGLEVTLTPSSHGLSLLPFGTLVLHDAIVPSDQVWPWPASGKSAALGDGLLTALLSGLTDELAARAIDYALQRYQGGKMIHEHDAVRQLVGPIEQSRRVLRALAHSTLGEAAAGSAGDGGASAFAVELARKSGLDAVQTLGGNGYMQDYRVERYLRDANTLETFWIHADARRRAIARAAFARLVH